MHWAIQHNHTSTPLEFKSHSRDLLYDNAMPSKPIPFTILFSMTTARLSTLMFLTFTVRIPNTQPTSLAKENTQTRSYLDIIQHRPDLH
jgi:hypothetical protein